MCGWEGRRGGTALRAVMGHVIEAQSCAAAWPQTPGNGP